MHPLLARQIKETLGEIDVSLMTSGWRKFFDLADKTYHSTDAERAMLDRSLEISSKEYAEAHENLKNISILKDATIQDLQVVKEAQEKRIAELESELAALKQKTGQ